MATIDLEAENKILRFEYEITESNLLIWCRVSYIDAGEERELGAETIDRVLPSLIIGFLDLKERKWYTYGGLEICPITILMGPESQIAGHIDDRGDLELLYVDTLGNITPLMKLTEDEKINWIKQISKNLTDFMLEHCSR